MPRKDFVKEYMDVRSKTFKPTTITTAFLKSGCWPINRGIFTDEDYAPSIAASRRVPRNFPVQFEGGSDDEYPAHSMEDFRSWSPMVDPPFPPTRSTTRFRKHTVTSYNKT